MNRPKKVWLAVLYAASLLAAIVVWVILYGRGVEFRFAGVYITPGIFTFAAMVLVDVLIFLMLW
jgi:hypothetical protein